MIMISEMADAIALKEEPDLRADTFGLVATGDIVQDCNVIFG
jgi:hypothetical protein